jgi:hypothetical protein
MLHPDFPVIEGHYQMTKQWSVELPEPFNRRFEEGSMVLWRPGLTLWVAVWSKNQNQTQEERLARLLQDISAQATDQEELREHGLIFLSYRLSEESEDNRRPAFYGFAIGISGQVQMGIYFDDEADLSVARKVWLSLREESMGELQEDS